MIQQVNIVCDMSTLANFKAWAQTGVSDWFATAGWIQASDTGQVNWSTIVAPPTSGNYVYEIWKPGDGLATFYVKVEYGNNTGAPKFRVSIGSSTDGAGNLTGFFTTAGKTVADHFTPPSTTTQYECNFSGDSGKIAIMLWRNAPNQAPQIIAIQRSLNSSGAPTSEYVTFWLGGAGLATAPGTNGESGFQQSLHLTLGPGPVFWNRDFNGFNWSGWAACCSVFEGNGSSAFNGGIPISFSQPCMGRWDYPCTVVGAIFGPDITEGVPFTITNQYGQTKTYMPTKSSPLNQCFGAANGSVSTNTIAVCMEYD